MVWVLLDEASSTRLWRSGQQHSAINRLIQRIRQCGPDTASLAQLVIWHHNRDNDGKVAKLLVKLARHLQLDRRPVPPADEPIIRTLLDHLDPSSAGHNLTSRYFVLLAHSVETKYGARVAAKFFHAASRRDSTYPAALIGLARTLQALRKYSTCLQAVEQGVSRLPYCVELYRIGLHVAQRCGLDELAAEYAKRWSHVEPANLEPLTVALPWFFGRNELNRCRDAVARATSADPDNPQWWNLMAAIELLWAGQTDRQQHLLEAQAALQRSLAIDPDQADVRIRLKLAGDAMIHPDGRLPVGLLVVPEQLKGRNRPPLVAEAILPDAAAASTMSFGSSVLASLPETEESDEFDPYASA